MPGIKAIKRHYEKEIERGKELGGGGKRLGQMGISVIMSTIE